MKRIALIMVMALIMPLCYSQQYSVNINRTGGLIGSASKLTIKGPDGESTTVGNKSSSILAGTLPSDSIIELSFKRSLGRPSRYFLYPNGTYQYTLATKVGMMGIQIFDMSAYPGKNKPENPGKTSAWLPKGFKVARNLSVSYVYEKPMKSDEIRKQWARQGGKLIGRSITYLGTFGSIAIKEPDLKTTTTIIGGGWTYTQNYYNLKIPQYKTGIATWNSLIYGYAGSVSMHLSQVELEPAPSPDYDSFGSGAFILMFTGNIGYTLGLGKFKTEADYKGVALDLTYKPSLTYSFGPGGSFSEINYMGFGFDISRTSFSAFANRIAPKAKSKFSFFFLPPLKDNSPLLITLGYGLVWYR
jgi:hypothetical protein